MSVTLWVHSLEDRQITQHTKDHTLLNKFTRELDPACESAGVTKLSTFVDYTDANANNPEDDGSADSEELDPETGWSYGIDDMTWFPAKDGLATLTSLRTALASGGIPSIPREKVPSLIAELDSCIAKLSEPASRDAKFHLGLVM
jgi:hypothetical protein